MPYDLYSFAQQVSADSGRWESLGMTWTFGPVGTSTNKPSVQGAFKCLPWTGELTVWVTGEADLDTMRWSDSWTVYKTYRLEGANDLQTVLSELADLVAYETVPPGAFTYHDHAGHADWLSRAQQWTEATVALVRSIRQGQAAAAAACDQRDQAQGARMRAIVGQLDEALERWEAVH